ncbi:MarR family transcriptional regulator [Labedella phragmitis]|uniref:MarR family transcriptional regulator n=3 Tax=Microbacteriaceae TaxID=85023 RepID=A0A3S4AZR8_9MICO|nr:MarR family transcriptional regulator [Labedella phragmitis]RWZ59697.1 MarR family transcriptional regulator [Labedella populi]
MAATQVNLGLLSALRQIAVHDDRARVQDVADGSGMTVGAASKIVDRLERAGFVRRLPHPTDRRSSLLEMTAEGRAALKAGMRAARAELGRRTDTLSPDELAETTKNLDALRVAFGGRAD